ncbi:MULTISPECIES: MarR family transcriptional regulator [unclassified Paenibacillus]|uniref:MarR family transcriptional regulator n=1 Tax=unclassified Paenibacillus TaxID=185978 RepID=UPI001C10D573|nr:MULTISPECIES: MarR family transcriptional regulator [unclassified Paenibacillus]MBU5445050.1 MarR family transcriptional regulator [Paenibacillus sp. MSJ-34]CAH0122630.1 HTH-type transcriptional regulator PchR [Paenibacillus sp. CECT 9249]
MRTNDMLKTAIHENFIRFFHQKEQYENREISVFLEELRKMIEAVPALNMTEVHTIACIGEQEPINVTSIAEKMNLSKGNTSKVTNKLLKTGWVRKTQLNDNKKEVYFRLTPAGKRLYALHDELHNKERQRMYEFLNQYSETELDFIKRLFGDLGDFYR